MQSKKTSNWLKALALNIASGIYSYLGWFRIKMYGWGIRKSHSLPVPVIAVGDLSLGGGGKTPAVIALAGLLRDQGQKVALLCSGYKAKKAHDINVVSDGGRVLATVEQGGDEPVMLAHRLPGVVVLSGKNRAKLGRYAVNHFGATLCILDGGYQHLALDRDFNILLVNPSYFGRKTRTSQILREPLSGMKRADLCLMAKGDPAKGDSSLKKRIQQIKPGLEVVQGTLSSRGLFKSPGDKKPLTKLTGKRVFAFCGIADPESFYQDLRKAGATICGRHSFADHHPYSKPNYDKLLQKSSSLKADLMVTSEKDFYKISPYHSSKDIPLLFHRVQLQFCPNHEKILNAVMDSIQKKEKKSLRRQDEVIIPNLNHRYSGITSTILCTFSALQKYYPMVALGNGLPNGIPAVSWGTFLRAYRKGPQKIWHARRNIEMLVGILLKKIFRFPLILLFTSTAQRKHRWLTRKLYHQMDALIASTPQAASFLDLPSDIINLGIDTTLFRPPADRRDRWVKTKLPGQFGIGIFGRIRPQKGTEEFVDALCDLLPSFPNWTGILIGETTPKFLGFQKKLQEKIKKARLADRILFLGKLEDFSEIPQWYQAVSIVVAPPWVEGYGLTGLEGMASGCAVVATRTGAFELMIDPDKTGKLIPCRDRGALKGALKELLDQPEQIKEMGTRARRRVEENFSNQKEAKEIAQVYKKLFKSFQTSRPVR